MLVILCQKTVTSPNLKNTENDHLSVMQGASVLIKFLRENDNRKKSWNSMSAAGRGFGRSKEHKALSKFRNKSQHRGSVSRCSKGTYVLAFTSYAGSP